MKLISVSSKRPLEVVREALRSEVTSMQKAGIRVFLREHHRGPVVALRCDGWGSERTPVDKISSRLKSVVANALADVIIDEYEEALVGWLVDQNYGFLSTRDRGTVKEIVLKKLDGRNGTGADSSAKQQRKSMVWAKIVEYLDKEDDVILEGFVTFRLKEYLEYLAGAVQSVVEEYLTRREYREFLRLLRHFMKMQTRSMSLLNVVRRGRNYELLDEEGKEVSGVDEKLGPMKSAYPELSEDDLLVSAVVALAPQKLVWHGPTERSTACELLADLLEGRFEVCPGCRWDLDPGRDDG